MSSKMIKGKNGYYIPCQTNIIGNEKKIAVISHGFGAGKDTRTAEAFSRLPYEYGIGTICFDFPAHGESPADTRSLRVENCVSDLGAVGEYAKELAPEAEIVYFATSFGAYITLIYLCTRGKKGCKAFLKSAALNMPDVLRRHFMPEGLRMDRYGLIELLVPVIGTVKVPREFVDELENYDVFELWRPETAELAMLHGVSDTICDISAARRFAVLTGADLVEIEGAGHFGYPGSVERAVTEAAAFYIRDKLNDLTIRKMEQHEVNEALGEVWEIFIERFAPKCPIDTAIILRKLLEQEASSGNIALYGAFSEGRLFGAAVMKKDLSHMYLLLVGKKYIGYGVTRMLMNAVLKESSAERITLNAIPVSEEMYRHLGFVPSADASLIGDRRFVPMEYKIRKPQALSYAGGGAAEA